MRFTGRVSRASAGIAGRRVRFYLRDDGQDLVCLEVVDGEVVSSNNDAYVGWSVPCWHRGAVISRGSRLSVQRPGSSRESFLRWRVDWFEVLP